MKKYFVLLLLTLFLGSLMTGCKKKPGDPPVLPSAESMIIDFSNFETGKGSGDIVLPKGVEDSNWSFAALMAGYWRTIVFSTLIVPVTAFDHAIDQTPVYLDDNTWQWSYSVSVFTVTYKARLTGQKRASDVLWKMYITKEGPTGYPEFLWFEGTSDFGGTEGQWTLYHSSQFPEPLLTIDWTDDGSEVTFIKYTYVRELNDSRLADPYKNSYIEYGLTSGTYDRYYEVWIYYNSAFATMNAEWNSVTLNGRVQCQPFFGDPDWHCWDSNYLNVDC